jgi:probable metal-binding protein
MSDAIAIHGHEIIDLIASYPEGIRLGLLMNTVADRYGRMATFHTGSMHGMDLDALLRCLEAREKVRITNGVVYPGGLSAR